MIGSLLQITQESQTELESLERFYHLSLALRLTCEPLELTHGEETPLMLPGRYGDEGLLQSLLGPLETSWSPGVQLPPGLEVAGERIPLLTWIFD